MASVTSERVAEYLPLVEAYARRYVGFAQSEYDDLRQEGMIAVWQTLERGLRPSPLVINGRMLDWVSYLRRLQRNDAIAYEVMLPMDEFPDV